MKWTLENRLINDLIENEKNPRRLSKEQGVHLEKSLSKFGVCEPIVINIDNTIIGGHQRARILKKMGKKEVEVYVPDRPLDQKESDELNIRLNKNTGDFDYDLLANVWEPTELVNWGFTPAELSIDILPGNEELTSESLHGATKMNIKFADSSQLQEAENRISTILDEFKGTTYKVKI